MTDFILEVIAWGGYAGIFALMALENVVPPVPSEIILGFGGVLVARGEMDFVPLVIAGTAGTLFGNLPWYWLGRRWREDQLRRFIDRFGRWLTFEWSDFERARDFFRKYGEPIVFFVRFSPVLRTIVSLPAGLARMNFWRFCLFTTLGSLVWNVLIILGGQAASGLIARYEDLASAAIIASVALGLAWYVWRVIKWRPRDGAEAQD